MESQSKRIVRSNILMLLNRDAGPLPKNQSGVTRLKAYLKVPQGSAQRLLDDVSDLQLGSLDRFAAALKVESWQLLTPWASANSPPQQHPPSTGLFSPQLSAALSAMGPEEIRKIENSIRSILDMDPLPRPANALQA